MPALHRIADDYVERLAALDPLAATGMGVPGHDHEVPDFSPDGAQARAALDAETLAALDSAPAASARDLLARDVMAERMLLSRELFEAGEHLRDLNIIASPMQRLRGAFDLMPAKTDGDWENIAARMEAAPMALRGMRASLEAGRGAGPTVAARQVRATIAQARTWAGSDGEPSGFFAGLIAKDGAPSHGALASRLRDAAVTASAAYDAWADYLETGYLPAARPDDGVGAERYALRARVFTGLRLDLGETYAWGWEELRRIRAEMAATADRIVPGGSLSDAVRLLETDPARAIDGEEPFRQWMQDVQDRTIAELGGAHFEIPAPVRTVEAMIAPPGGALAMYYTGPSEDFSRPGRTWYPTGGRTRFPLWAELSVAYHEGVPGASSADRDHALPGGCADALSAPAGGHVGLRGGVGAVRGAADVGAGLLRESRPLSGIPEQPGAAGGAGRGRYRPAPGPDDPGRRTGTRGRGLATGVRAAVPARALLLPRGDAGQRGRSLPGLAGPGDQLQGRRAGVAAGAGRRPRRRR